MIIRMVQKSGQIFLPCCHSARVSETDEQTEVSSPDRMCIPYRAVTNTSYTYEICCVGSTTAGCDNNAAGAQPPDKMC